MHHATVDMQSPASRERFWEGLRSRMQVGRIDEADPPLAFDDADRTSHAHVADAAAPGERRESGAQSRLDLGGLRQPRLALEQVERRIRGGTRQRICHIGRAVHEHAFGVDSQESPEHMPHRNGGG